MKTYSYLNTEQGKLEPGDEIRIISMVGENKRYNGRTGIIMSIDDIGQLHGTWGGLAVIPTLDEIEIIKKGRRT